MSFANDWANNSKQQRQTAILALLNDSWPPGVDYINLVRTPGHWGVCASTGTNFGNAVFGRDSLIVAEDLLLTHQSLAHDIIITLAKLQGHTQDLQSEEEPGKIHHEFRAQHLIDETAAIPLTSLQRMVDLEHDWGIQGHDYFIYYGSHDATPLFVRLLGKYVETYGDGILKETYIARDSNTYTIHDAVKLALAWITAKIGASQLGLLEYKRLNRNALINQAWKDSPTAYLYADGTLADGDHGIASVELQGYAYDSLMTASKHFAEIPQQAEAWQQLAKQIQWRVVSDMWMSGDNFFAQGLAHDQQGSSRQIDTLTSNAGVLLDSRLLLDLPEADRQPIVDAIARTIYSPEFVTDAGVRTRALRHQALPGYIDYHGSFSIWPKETWAVAQGLRSHGYPKLAEQLENRLLRSMLLAGEFFELIYADTDGTIIYDLPEELAHFNAKSPAKTIPVPEPGQAWSISAALRILYNRSQKTADTAVPANSNEQTLLAALPTITVPTSLDNQRLTNDPTFTTPS